MSVNIYLMASIQKYSIQLTFDVDNDCHHVTKKRETHENSTTCGATTDHLSGPCLNILV